MKHPLILLCLTISTSVFSQPRYEWRGIMLDVSRHFMPVDDVKRQIDAMQMCNLNILHLHLTDAAGWRIEIKGYPRLTQVGAWRTHHLWKTWWNGDRGYTDTATQPTQTAYGGYYTQEQLRDLVHYADERGITIVPEIEFPAHSEEVIAAYPELGYNHAEMDMQKPVVYQFMRDVLTQVAEIFPSPYLHLGGDEAATQHSLQPEGMRRLNAIVRELGRDMVVWDEALSTDPADSSMIIMVWRNPQTAQKALDLGHRVVFSPGAYCYLDKYQDAPPTQPEAMGGYLTLHSMYDSIAHAVQQPMLQHPRMLGLQANLWTEYIPTVRHAEYMLWPRALVIAEGGMKGTDMHTVGWQQFRRKALRTVKQLQGMGLNPFPLNKEAGQRREYCKPVRNSVSRNCNVSYLNRYHKAYTAAGDATLTDGRRGGWSNTDGRWQGFIGSKGMDVVIDLKRIRSIRSVKADFMQIVEPDIFLPARIIISVSTDGEHFTQLCDRQYDYDNAPVTIATRSWQGKSSARYLRFQALPGSRQGWIFCDEIIVK